MNLKKSSSDVVLIPLLFDGKAAGGMLGRKSLLNQMLAYGWLKPVVDRHKCKLFCPDDLRRCVARLKKGEYPGEKK